MQTSMEQSDEGQSDVQPSTSRGVKRKRGHDKTAEAVAVRKCRK